MKKIFFLLFVLFILFSCKKSEFSKIISFPDDTWKVNNILQFNPIIKDTLQQYNLTILIRNNDNYQYSNIYMFVHILQPDNTLITDTVEGILADQKGNWLGKGKGKYKKNSFIYRKGVRFPKAGTYSLTIEHAMRTENLEGIESVGIEIDKSQ